MKTRDVVIFTGKKFKVPQGIQRIDHRATHGWQLRYGGTKLFSDGSMGSATAAFFEPYADDGSTAGLLMHDPDRHVDVPSRPAQRAEV